MDTPTPSRVDPATSFWATRALTTLYLVFSMTMGIFILLGGDDRFAGRSYSVALSYPGAPESWGTTALVIGAAGVLASVTSHTRYVWWCMMALATWSLFFAISFMQVALHDPQSTTTGIVVYFHIAVSSVLLGLAHRRAERK